MDRMVLHPVNRFILKIVFKMRGKDGVASCKSFNPQNPVQDEGQDGIASCKSFHPQNRVQDEGKGLRGASHKRRFSLRLCGFASEKNTSPPCLNTILGI